MHLSRRTAALGALALSATIGTVAVAASSAAAPPRTIYVANAGVPSTITALNAATGKVTKSISAGDGIAVSVAVSPSGRKAYALIVGSDEEGEPGLMLPINTATNASAKPIKVGVDPNAVAFSPNGATAYVVDGFDAATTPPKTPGTVTPVKLATGRPERPIKVGTNPGSIAVTPNGHKAYVTAANPVNGDPTTITPIDLANNRPDKPIHVAARALAISLNGKTVFALGPAGVVPISTATNLPGKAIRLGGVPAAVALAPDGQLAWVLATPRAGSGSGSSTATLTAINTTTNAVGKVIKLKGLPTTGQFFIAITPNGGDIYVLAQGSGKRPSTLVPISASTGTPATPLKVGTDDTAILASPDSETVYVLSPGSDYRGAPTGSHQKPTPGTVIPIATATNKPAAPIKVGLAASALAIAP